MSEVVWFNDPAQLFRNDKILKFWPNNSQSSAERINASTRFILYTAAILYAMRRDPRILTLAIMVVAVIYILYKGHMVREGSAKPVYSHEMDYTPDCQLPTAENPMANYITGDDSSRPPACYYPTVKELVKENLDNTIPYDCGRSRCALPKYQRNAAARQFVSNPVTTAYGDQTEFAEWCYGKKFRPTCRSDPSQCDPNARGVQLEAFAGIDPAGNARSGMSRGTV